MKRWPSLYQQKQPTYEGMKERNTIVRKWASSCDTQVALPIEKDRTLSKVTECKYLGGCIMKLGVPVRVSDEVKSMGRSADIEEKKTSLSLLDDPVCNVIFM